MGVTCIRSEQRARVSRLIKPSFMIVSLLMFIGTISKLQELQRENELLRQWVNFEIVAPTAPLSNSNDHRKCSRLVLFLHIHKAGGTSILEFMKNSGIASIDEVNAQFKPPLIQLRSTQDLAEPIYGMYGSQCDQILVSSSRATYLSTTRLKRANRRCFRRKRRTSESALLLPSPTESAPRSYPPPLQLSDASLWRGIHMEGVDYVAFEYNFLPPYLFVDHSDEISSATVSLVQLREPWSRFHSTYLREIYRLCRLTDYSKNGGKKIWVNEACAEDRPLAKWIGDPFYESNVVYPGILKPNYMVRMLNGLTDDLNPNLTQGHLKFAKMALEKFDLVLYIEMPEEERVAALRTFFGANDTVMLEHKSNNLLKKRNAKLYDKVFAESSLLKPVFEELNSLDIELYDFAKSLVDRRQKALAVHC